MAIWRMRITFWIPEATKTHSKYEILVVFPLQKWKHERASMLRYTTLPVVFPLLLTKSRNSNSKSCNNYRNFNFELVFFLLFQFPT